MTKARVFDIIVQMKKIFLGLPILALSLCLCGCAQTPDRTVNEPRDAILELSLYATGERGKVAPLLAAEGHAYTSVKNISSSPISLGEGYELPAGATVTIASWEFDAHGGVWFNIEPTYIDQGWFVKRKSITRKVDVQGVARMNAYLSADDTDNWTLFHNCTHFAVGLWNEAASGSGDEIEFGGKLTPSQLEDEILRFDGYEVGRPHDSTQPIGYFGSDGFIEFHLAE